MSVIKVYLVEDSPVILDNLVAMLEELISLKVVGNADNEVEAVDWLNNGRNHCDLILIDVFLKHGAGLGVLKAMQGKHSGQRLVVLTNYATADMRLTCLQMGADRVFDKSDEIDALVKYCDHLTVGETGPGSIA